MAIQLEQTKAELGERERLDKAAKDKADFQRQTVEAGHKAEMDKVTAAHKAMEAQYKIADAARALDIKMLEGDAKNAKTGAEVQKIGVQVLEILSGINIEEQKMALEIRESENGEAEETEEAGKRDGEMAEIKQLLTAIGNQEPVDIAAAIAPLAEAIKGMKDGGDNFAVEIQGIKDSVAGLSGGSMQDMMAPIAEAIKSLKTESGTKKITIERNKDGNLEGEITTEE